MKRKIILTILAGLVTALLIASCSRATPSQKQDNMGSGAEIAISENYNYGMDYKFAGSTDDYIEYEPETWETGSETGSGTGSGGNGSTEVNVDPTKSRLLIRTVYMSVETKELDKVKNDVEALVSSSGGYIESSNMSGTGKDKNLRTLTYTIRVPADKIDAIIETVGNSCTVLSSNENSTDVTLEYVDTQARIESLRVEYDQLIALLKNAEDLDTIIVLQNRITDVRYEIESYESRLRVLENQVTYATLNLTVKEVLEETVIEPAHVPTYGERAQKQFEEMLDDTKEFFEDLGLVIIACLPGIAFLGINVIIIIAIVKSIKKKRRKAKEQKLNLNNQGKEETLYLGGNDRPKHVDNKPTIKNEKVQLAGDVICPDVDRDIALEGEVSIMPELSEIKAVNGYKTPEYAKAGKEPIETAKLTKEVEPLDTETSSRSDNIESNIDDLDKVEEETKAEIAEIDKKLEEEKPVKVADCKKEYMKEKHDFTDAASKLMTEDRANEEDENI